MAWLLPRSASPDAAATTTSTSPRASTSTSVAATTGATTSPRATEPATPATNTPPPTPVVRRQGNVTLAGRGSSIDLNAPPTDKSWGVRNPTGDTDRMALSSGTLITPDKKLMVARLTVPATLQGCQDATNYTDMWYYGIELSSLADRPMLCLHLTSGRYATFSKVSQTDDSVTLNITVWE